MRLIRQQQLRTYLPTYLNNKLTKHTDLTKLN